MAVMDTIESGSASREERGGDTPAAPVSTGNNPENTSSTPVSAAISVHAGFTGSTPVSSSLNPATKRTGGLLHLRGPSPEKGSGQDRFRKMIEASRDLTSFRDNKDPMSTPAASTKQLPSVTPCKATQSSIPHYSPGLPSVVAPPFTLRTTSTTKVATVDKNSTDTMPPGVKIEPLIPTQRSGFANGDANANGNGKGPPGSKGLIGGEWRPTATATLSLECQKRSFNPAFTEHVTENGEFTYSVRLNGIVMRSNRSFPTAAEAKQALARQAVARVRKMPCQSPNTKAFEKVKYEATRLDAVRNRNEGGPAKEPVQRLYEPRTAPHIYPATAGVPVARPVVANHNQMQPYNGYDPGFAHGYNPMGYDLRLGRGYDLGYDRREEQSFLVDRVQSLYGRSGGPSSPILKDPLASQAFLEGFALGSRLHESARRQHADFGHPQAPPAPVERTYAYTYQHRERSPASLPNRVHRERSPLRHRPTLGYNGP
ncbi:hypothetical protein F5X99DRAFT_425040 [Biscogniauxia marginata]|nr:hypothetical protein F5X99DRAFT_425040 [Biscogniauxia marginata]